MSRKVQIILFTILAVLLAVLICCCTVPVVSVVGYLDYTNEQRASKEPKMQGVFPLHEKWNVQVSHSISATPTIYKDLVIFPAATHVYALSIAKGSLVWEAELNDFVSKPIKVCDNFVVAGGMKAIHVLDLTSGAELWKKSDSRWMDARPMACSNTVLLVQYSVFNVFAYDVRDGNVLWSSSYDRDAVNAFPDGDFVYLFSNFKLTKHVLRTGEKVDVIQRKYYSGMSDYRDGIFYYDEQEGADLNHESLNILAYDPMSHQVLWTTTIDSGNISSPNKIIVDEHGILVGGRDSLAYLSLSGEQIWKNVVNGSQSPAIINDAVYFRGVFDENIYALSLNNGEQLGYLSWDTFNVFGQPNEEYDLGVASDDSILFFSMGDRLYAYESQ